MVSSTENRRKIRLDGLVESAGPGGQSKEFTFILIAIKRHRGF